MPGPSLISFQDQQIAEDVVNTALLPVFTQMRIRTGRSEFSFLTSVNLKHETNRKIWNAWVRHSVTGYSTSTEKKSSLVAIYRASVKWQKKCLHRFNIHPSHSILRVWDYWIHPLLSTMNNSISLAWWSFIGFLWNMSTSNFCVYVVLGITNRNFIKQSCFA